MSVLETFLGLPSSVTTAVLLISIVLTVILAFKVLEMVFETVTIAVLSGVFYGAMTFLFDVAFSFNDLLLFAFLGASLYMLYSVLITAFNTAETALKVPYKVFMAFYRPTKRIANRVVRKLKRKLRERNEEEVTEKSTKEVVLDKD